QVFDLLLYLIQNRERVVSKDDLIASVWGGRIVSDAALGSRLNAARKAVGDNGERQRRIRTISRRGVRLVGTVHTRATASDQAQPPRLALARSDQPAIAVLPFVNMSGDQAQEYFSDGISEDIITGLSKVRRFLVIARNSSFAYKGRAMHMKRVAEELGVG